MDTSRIEYQENYEAIHVHNVLSFCVCWLFARLTNKEHGLLVCLGLSTRNSLTDSLTGLLVLTLLLDVDTGGKFCVMFSIFELSVSLRVEGCVKCL